MCDRTRVPGSLQRVSQAANCRFKMGRSGWYTRTRCSHTSHRCCEGSDFSNRPRAATGGQLTFTTQGRRFLELCCAIRTKAAREPLAVAEKTIDSFFDNPFRALSDFREDDTVYTGVGGGGVLAGDFYGWAAIPESWLHSNLSDFVIEDVTDDPKSTSRSW